MTRLASALLGSALALVPLAADAETFVLDTATGAVHDAVGDGWFFAGPAAPPPDGIGDLGGQALAVGRIAGVLELRAMSEFPLAALGGLSASQIQSATVTITIDDVLSTFGPGAAFDGTASSPMAVYHYPADGAVTVADFAPAGLAPLGIVTPGVVTDASLAVTGALPFAVDVTAALRAALDGGEVAFGVLVGTVDTPTGTSLDGLAPPGVAGGALPFLTVTTVPLVPPSLAAAEQICQATIAKAGQKLVGTGLKAFATCFGGVLKDQAPDQLLTPATAAKCAAAIDPADADSQVGKALAKLSADVTKRCGALTPAAIGSPCDPAATSMIDVVACLQDTHRRAIAAAVRSQYGAACTLLNAVGLVAGWPGVCTP